MAPGGWPRRPPLRNQRGPAFQPETGFFGAVLTAIAVLPGLLNQFHVPMPPWLHLGNQPGQSGASTPVPADVAKTLNEIGPQLDDVLARSKKLLPEKVEGKPK